MESWWRIDWIATVLQAAPRIAALRRHMRPTIRLNGIDTLDAAVMKAFGVRGVMWDVDGTLMRRHGTAVAPHLAQAFARLAGDPALCHVILSNCDERRFVQLASIFPTIPIIRAYATDRGLIVRRRIGDDDTWSDVRPMHHQRPTGALRKPSLAIFRVALEALEGVSPAHALMVGDQYLTDIAPANMLGVITVKVNTVEPRSFPVAVRALQMAERVLFSLSPSRH
ncbi:MAG: HAD hydrolase-like protein [Gemmatimonadaceae bacterium]